MRPQARKFLFGPFEFDVRAGELRKHGVRIKLREQPVRLLVMLLEHPGEVVLRDEISLQLWPNNTVVEFDHGINTAIQRVRDALGESADSPLYVETVARRGAANFGFRCARYDSNGDAAKAADPVTLQPRNFSQERPVSDSLYQVYKGLYSYDKTPLDARVESTEQNGDWRREKITFAAAYGNERVAAYLFLPVNVSPPFQVVVYFPGSYAVPIRSSLDSSGNVRVQWPFDFLIKGGRAVMAPIYKGTYERGGGLKNAKPNTTTSYRDHIIAMSKDLGRSIDYLETRPDIDRGKVAYEGYSWGAGIGAVMVAAEDRIKVCVLILPGFHLQKCLPEVDELNFAPHVKVPVLMLNGRFDFIFPGATSQEPMFRLLGTPDEQKRRVIYDTGHNLPRHEMIKESLDWLDRYLGPVK